MGRIDRNTTGPRLRNVPRGGRLGRPVSRQRVEGKTAVATRRPSLNSRRKHDRALPPVWDGAPRWNGLDLRWSSAYQFIVTSLPDELHVDIKNALWELLMYAWDQGSREHSAGKPNPFMNHEAF